MKNNNQVITDKLSQKDVTTEQAHLFQKVIHNLEKDEQELAEQYSIARNLACSEWSKDFIGRIGPNKMFPERMDLLEKNFNTLRSEISRKRYFAIVLFWTPREKSGIPLTAMQAACFNYWNPILKLKGFAERIDKKPVSKRHKP